MIKRNETQLQQQATTITRNATGALYQCLLPMPNEEEPTNLPLYLDANPSQHQEIECGNKTKLYKHCLVPSHEQSERGAVRNEQGYTMEHCT